MLATYRLLQAIPPVPPPFFLHLALGRSLCDPGAVRGRELTGVTVGGLFCFPSVLAWLTCVAAERAGDMRKSEGAEPTVIDAVIHSRIGDTPLRR